MWSAIYNRRRHLYSRYFSIRGFYDIHNPVVVAIKLGIFFVAPRWPRFYCVFIKRGNAGVKTLSVRMNMFALYVFNIMKAVRAR